MAYEVIFVCNSINNRNIRRGELKILRKNIEELCFEFGESENNIKKRFYRTVEALNEDYKKVEELRKREEKGVKKEEELVETERNVSDEKEVKNKKNSKKNIF